MMFDSYGVAKTCGNCDTYKTCKNPYKDVNTLCSDAKDMWNEEKQKALKQMGE